MTKAAKAGSMISKEDMTAPRLQNADLDDNSGRRRRESPIAPHRRMRMNGRVTHMWIRR